MVRPIAGVENPSWVMRRLNWVFSTPPPIRKSRAEAKRAPKEKSVETIPYDFQQFCSDELSARLKRPHVISVIELKNQAKKIHA